MSLFNQPLEHPAVWRGAELFARPEWEWTLTPADRAEIEAAIAASAGCDPETLRPETFPLDRVAGRLREIQIGLEDGPGATRVRGLPTATLTADAQRRMFAGITAHLGTPVSQSAAGALTLAVEDAGFAPDDPRFRGPHSRRPLAFHTDRCDVIAFLCVRPAAVGGANEVLSSMALCNELLARSPTTVAVLQESFPYLRHVIDPGNPRPFTGVPVFSEADGHFAASLLRVLIDRADASPEAPDLRPAQRNALDTLERVAATPGLSARFRLETGDLLLLNNWVTMHRREEFEDDPAPDARRLLLRRWLAVPNSRPLDPRLGDHFGATAPGAIRGGIHPKSGPPQPDRPG